MSIMSPMYLKYSNSLTKPNIYLLCFLFHLCRSLSTSPFPLEVFQWLDRECVSWNMAEFPAPMVIPQHHYVIELNRNRRNVYLHLIPSPKTLKESSVPSFNKRLTDLFSFSSGKVIHLHQDVWLAKPEIVKSRLLAQVGIVKRIFARKTQSKRINATTAIKFLEKNHLWGATKAKYYFGLFGGDDELLAVATFSSRRKVIRDDQTYKSHELLRYCAQRDSAVVGGISKLCKRFISEIQPDDIVTVIDRDWGDASGWHSMGFESVGVMDPIAMAVNPREPGVRRHLVGAGIQHNSDNKGRVGLPLETMEKLGSLTSSDAALKCLAGDNFYPVYDSGVERLLKVVSSHPEQQNANDLWNRSKPTYASQYYSNNAGISSILEYAASEMPPSDSSREM